MMRRRATKREYFVSISLEEYVPEDHLLHEWEQNGSRLVKMHLAARTVRPPTAEWTGLSFRQMQVLQIEKTCDTTRDFPFSIGRQ
jgi:hypothetical protein